MPYYNAGDYYGRGDYYRGDPGILGALKRVGAAAVNVVKGVVRASPAGQIISAVAPNVLGNTPARPTMALAPSIGGGGGLSIPRMAPPVVTSGSSVVGVSPLGTLGIRGIKGRRMNMGNAKAARRAIRRIKGVRHLLQSIERELPRRPAKQSSHGVITRAEAARALRS